MSFNGMAAEVITFKDGDIYAVHIRSLASSCAACHGTSGNAVSNHGVKYTLPPLAGLKADYFVAQMLAFKSTKLSPLIMQRHATGLTTEEVNALGNYFSNQKLAAKALLNPQILNKNHAQ